MRSDPQDQHDAGEHDEDDDRGQNRARGGRTAGGFIGLLDFAAKALVGYLLAGIGLHGADRADQFGDIGGRIGQRILGVARQPPHPAPECHQRQHDHRDRQQHEARESGARDHHHHGGTDEHQEVAQRNRHRSPDRGFDLGGIGGQPRDQFTAARRIRRRPATARADARARRAGDRRRCVRRWS